MRRVITSLKDAGGGGGGSSLTERGVQAGGVSRESKGI